MRTSAALALTCLVSLSSLACGGAPSGAADSTSEGESESGSGDGDVSEDDGPGADVPADLPAELDDCDVLEQLVVELELDPDADARQEQIDGFVREQRYGEHGFPIVAGTRLCVVHEGAAGQQLSVAGDFDRWQPDAHPLSEAAPGFYVAVVDLPAAPVGIYKLVSDGTEFFADPLARRFGWDQFGEYSQIDALPERSHHERWPGFDQGVGDLEPRTVTVWVPAGAVDGPALPVLYMHDGQNLFAPDALFGGWQVSATLDVAISEGALAPVIVVGIDNTSARFDEYTQTTDVLDGMVVGGRADEYADFLVDGVKPFIEGRYPVASETGQVAVMGSSLGGLVSLHIGLRHPQVFGHVASMSGTIAWGTFGAANPTIIDAYLESPPLGLRIYLDSGGDEGLGCPDDGSDNYCGNVALADALRGLGWVDEQDLFYRWDPGAPHNEAAWASRLLPALIDWFPGA